MSKDYAKIGKRDGDCQGCRGGSEELGRLERRKIGMGEVGHCFCVPEFLKGEIAVSQLKPGEKSEALMVKVESRDGLTHVWLSPIVRSPDGVALAAPMEITEPTGGRLGSFFAV